MSFLITATLNYQAARAQEELHKQNLLELEAEELGGGERMVPAGLELVVLCMRLHARGWVLGVDKTPTCMAPWPSRS